ncbi:MAG: DUF2784 domain-containing protein [Treponema sp.]|nr:DUF2784 domain-containing protein [Treponema sp.]
MNQLWVADLIVSIHFVYVIIVVLGLVLIVAGIILKWRIVRNFWLRVIHLAMILTVVLEALLGINCPLTVWEYELRAQSGLTDTVSMRFIPRLIHKLIFYDFPSWVFTIAYCAFGAAVILTWILAPPKLPKLPRLHAGS